eukprot:790303-Prymnesium_polylepis.1
MSLGIRCTGWAALAIAPALCSLACVSKTLAACVSSGAPGRRDFAHPEFIPRASTMRADPAGAMSRVLVV